MKKRRSLSDAEKDMQISSGTPSPYQLRFQPNLDKFYPARARRACALRALGPLLAEGAPTVGGGRLFEGSTKFFYGNSCNSGTESRKIVSKVGN